MRKATKTLRFPYSGLSRNLSYQESVTPDGVKVYGTPDAMNVRGADPLLERTRGGSRPGLKRISGIASDAGIYGDWQWPNGEKVEWPEGEEVTFGGDTPTYLAPDGVTRCIDPHRVVIAKASKGAVPNGYSICCTYRGRIFVAKDTMWYCSRIGEPTDWDYGAYSDDPARATAGNVALATDKGDPITALIPINDKCLYIATARSLWVIVGEPTTGTMTKVSEGVGVCGASAWCYDGRHLWILSYQGVFTLAIGEHPIYFSYRVPQLEGTDASAVLVTDHDTNGVFIVSSSVGSWYVDKAAKSLWPFSFANEGMRPVSAAHILLNGINRTAFHCADGEWRYFDRDATTDDGEVIESFVLLGPFRISDDSMTDGMLAELYATMGEGSAEVKVEVFTGKSPEEAVRNVTAYAGDAFKYTIYGGWNNVFRPRIRGAWCVLKLSSNGRWAYESIAALSKGLGRLRA